MPTKVFITDNRGYSLVSDERDIMVSRMHYVEVLEWCAQNNIAAAPAAIAAAFGVNLWRIEDEAQRTLFMLRWL